MPASSPASMASTPRHRPIDGLGGGGSITAAIFLLALLPVTHRSAAQPLPPPPSPNYARAGHNVFDPSLVMVVVIIISAFLFLGFFTLYIRQCADVTVHHAVAAVGTNSMSPRRRGDAPGLSPEVLATFPTMAYEEAKALKVGQAALECAVCICEFEDDEALRLLPGCCHVFHPECIDAWLATHVTCPVCRCDLAAAAAAEDHDAAQAPASSAVAPAAETADLPPEHVVVVEDGARAEEAAVELARTGSQRRRPPAKLPRWNSTGHSMALDDVDRYTLRMPAQVRREIFAARRFHRAASCVAYPMAAGEGSSRAGSRGSPEGESSRGGWSMRLGWSDRWPSLFMLTISPWRRGDGGEESSKKGETEGSSRGRFAAVRAPFDWLIGGGTSGGGAKGNAAGEERGRSQ